jgi:predicted glycogen debranching enzyme
MIAFGADVCSDFFAASQREWIETNGIGGYASSTISGANTRRYHGLLGAATRPPLGRMVLLSKFEEALLINGSRYELSCNQYPGDIHPEGYRFLTGFRLDPFPVWTFAVDGVEIEKSVFMVYGENATVCSWSCKSPDARLELRPLVAFRDHHHLQREGPIDASFETSPGMVSIAPVKEAPRLYLAHNANAVNATGDWYRDFEYAIERERGFDYRESLFQPFALSFDLSADAIVIASTSGRALDDIDKLAASEKTRREEIVKDSGSTDEFTRQLALAADQFVVSRGEGKTVIAGYHWFSDWGRDTMISLPGLTLATGRPEIARDVLVEFSRHISEGMLPNRFPDQGETPEYNTVDATLWYFEAIRAYAAQTSDLELVRELYPRLVDIIDWHIRGTRYGIKVDDDGLLFAGEPGVQLTWMDAKIGDRVITPRTGKAVEIQALWYNALLIMSTIAEQGDDDPLRYVTMAEKTGQSFNDKFWNAPENCLFDVIDGEVKDATLRPNQILAVSMHHTMLPPERARSVVDRVEAELLTPVGLRSLSPDDPQYVKTYIGSPEQRDSAYHQGPVWGWLIGPFVDAYRRVHSKDARAIRRMREIIAGFERHLSEAMVGQVSEIFDGDAPHAPRGAAAQAWSVAELLRVARELSR